MLLPDVVKCSWLTNLTEPNCKLKEGYVLDGQLTKTMVVNISSASAEFAGDYWCQAIPTEPGELTNCTLSLLYNNTSDHNTGSASNENDRN
ncbi:hypothetical protein BaRGS_00030707, partial [Batillaria attramentaria]